MLDSLSRSSIVIVSNANGTQRHLAAFFNRAYFTGGYLNRSARALSYFTLHVDSEDPREILELLCRLVLYSSSSTHRIGQASESPSGRRYRTLKTSGQLTIRLHR